MSFHGCRAIRSNWATLLPRLPRYRAPAARALGLREDEVEVTFQSRFGSALARTLYRAHPGGTGPAGRDRGRRGKSGVRGRLPGNARGNQPECRDAFVAAGGRQFRYIPALNDCPPWIEGLTDLVERQLRGWPTGNP